MTLYGLGLASMMDAEWGSRGLVACTERDVLALVVCGIEIAYG